MKKTITLVFIVFAFSIFQLSMYFAQLDISKNLTSPHLNDGYHSESFIVIDENYDFILSDQMVSVATKSNVNLMVSMNGPSSTTFRYYWFLSDTKPLDSIIGMNKRITLEEFNQLTNPISNKSNSSNFQLNYILSNYTYELYPFDMIPTDATLPDIRVFSPSLENIDLFYHELEDSGIIVLKSESSQHNQMPSMLSLLPTIFINDPLILVIISLFIIVSFLYVFGEQKNIRIKSIFGHTRLSLISEYTIKLSKKYCLILVTVLMCMWGIKFKFDVFRLSYLLKYYMLIGIVGIGTLVLIVVGSISLSKQSNIRSQHDENKKSKSSWVLKPLKFVLTMILTMTLYFGISSVLDSYRNYTFIQNYASKYQNMMIMQASGDYTQSIFKKSDEIYDLIRNHQSVLYVKPFEENPTIENLDLIENHIVLANWNYINRQNLVDTNINQNKNGVILTQFENIEKAQELKLQTSLVCQKNSNCNSVEVIGVDKNKKIDLLTMNPTPLLFELEDDFILVPYTDSPQVFSLYFYIDSNEVENELKEILSEVINLNEISFIPLSEIWESDLNQQQTTLLGELLKSINSMILIAFVTSLVFYVSYKNEEKYYTIQWLYGVSPYEMWRLDFLSEVLLALIAMMLSVKLFNLFGNVWIYLIIAVFLLLTHLLALVFFNKYFYKHATIVVKER